MIAKLRSNFRLAKVLARILFVLTFVFANWQSGLMATVIAQSLLGVGFGKAKLWIALIVECIIGIVWMFILPLLVELVLRKAQFYTIPQEEYCLLAHLFFALGYFISGCLSIVHFFTPVMLVWGSVLFPFVASLIAAVGFYCVTAKLYFNDVTVVNYFKLFALGYLVILLLVEVL